MSTATLSLIKQPVLYSAIGSLEHVNCNSLINLNKRFLAPSKEFCKPRGRVSETVQSILIPPARQYFNGQEEQRTLHKSTSSQESLQEEILRPELQIFKQTERGNASLSDPDIHSVTDEKA